MNAAASVLGPWANFYVIAGSAAAALTGLMFVVISIIAGLERRGRSPEGLSTFATPTIVHYATVLLLAGIVTAPWHVLAHPAWLIVASGILGVAYVAGLALRAYRMTDYRADLEDWVWYMSLPFVAYAMLLTSGIGLLREPVPAMFLLAGAVLMFLCIGIHNAWDTVTYMTVRDPDTKD